MCFRALLINCVGLAARADWLTSTSLWGHVIGLFHVFKLLIQSLPLFSESRLEISCIFHYKFAYSSIEFTVNIRNFVNYPFVVAFGIQK